MNKKILYSLPIIFIGLILFTNIIYKKNSEDSDYPAYVANIEIDDAFFKELGEKDTVLFKILNSPDFYDTVSGAFVNTKAMMNEELYYEFEVDKINQRLKIESENDIIIIEDNVRYQIDKKDSTYKKWNETTITNIDENIGKLKPKDRVVGKDKEFIERSDSYLGYVKPVYNNELMTLLLFDDNWKIKNSKTYLGRQAIEIEKNLGFTGKSKENHIKVLMDKESGVTLKEEYYDRDENVVMSTIVKKIEFNKPVSPNFIRDYDNLSKYTLAE